MQSSAQLWRQFFRPQDLGWVLFFAVLALFGPDRSPIEISLLTATTIFQLIEPRLTYFDTPRGSAISILIKIALCFVLMGYTGGIISSFYITLLLPIITAATTRGPMATAIFTAIACASYLWFIVLVDRDRFAIEGSELVLRIAFLSIVAFLTYHLAEENRLKAQDAQASADQLAAANRSLRAAEAAVRRADRLAALGQLTAGLAHELRNPIATIKSSAEMLHRSFEADNAVASELAGFISAEVDRTNSLISRFLEFARPLQLRLSETDLTAVIDRAILNLKRQQPVTVFTNYSPDVRPIQGDAELLERVFHNLIQNAAQASPPEAAITVKTREANGGVEVAVIDRGAGIDPQHVESIFNPFFTTKKEGVGLGLAIVSKIVDEHNGKIAVESEPGQGSVFRVFLPLPAAAK